MPRVNVFSPNSAHRLLHSSTCFSHRSSPPQFPSACPTYHRAAPAPSPAVPPAGGTARHHAYAMRRKPQSQRRGLSRPGIAERRTQTRNKNPINHTAPAASELSLKQAGQAATRRLQDLTAAVGLEQRLQTDRPSDLWHRQSAV